METLICGNGLLVGWLVGVGVGVHWAWTKTLGGLDLNGGSDLGLSGILVRA